MRITKFVTLVTNFVIKTSYRIGKNILLKIKNISAKVKNELPAGFLCPSE